MCRNWPKRSAFRSELQLLALRAAIWIAARAVVGWHRTAGGLLSRPVPAAYSYCYSGLTDDSCIHTELCQPIAHTSLHC